ncbi:MAG: DUF1648 domain-containing protein [Candidatus Cybelea sp.]|jgi:hypothetical protein
MLVALLAAAGLVIVAATVILTATSYGQLPGRVPLHFGLDGTVNTWGPRPAVWLVPLVQLTIAAADAFVFTTVTDAARGLLIADFILALLWRAQVLIISTGVSGKDRADLRGFLLFFLFTLAAVLLVIFFTRP